MSGVALAHLHRHTAAPPARRNTFAATEEKMRTRNSVYFL
jgi:hypothetical protein